MSDRSGLHARLALERGTGFSLDVELSIGPGRTVALLGPNGAGKSTVVEMLAGLVRTSQGQVVLDGRLLDDAETQTFVPPESRGIGVVFQNYLLFPHLSVLENVAFGPKSRGVPTTIARHGAGALLASLGIKGDLSQPPSSLSGGQAQRVALARALATEPRMLLLDEPLAALDVATRTRLRRTLQKFLGDFGGPRLLITHEPAEAFLLADHIYVIEAGRITQEGTAEDIRLRPRTRYAADLAGANLLTAVGRDDRVQTETLELRVAESGLSGQVLATIHPRAISIYHSRPEGSPRNTWQTTVTHVEDLGERVRLSVGTPLELTVEITPEASRALELGPGSSVWISIKATEISVEALESPP